MRQEFISTVSHEIQSPLTSIAGFAKALREPGLSRGDEAALSLDYRGGERPSVAAFRRPAPADGPGVAGREPEPAARADRPRRADPRRGRRRRAPVGGEGPRRSTSISIAPRRASTRAAEPGLDEPLPQRGQVQRARRPYLGSSLRREGEFAVARFADEGNGIAERGPALRFRPLLQGRPLPSHADPARAAGSAWP